MLSGPWQASIAERDAGIEGLRQELARSVDAGFVALQRSRRDNAGREPRIIQPSRAR